MLNKEWMLIELQNEHSWLTKAQEWGMQLPWLSNKMNSLMDGIKEIQEINIQESEEIIRELEEKQSKLYQVKITWLHVPWLPAKLLSVRNAIKKAKENILNNQ